MAIAVNPVARFARAMIYDPADSAGVFVFLFRSLNDGPSDADYLYEDLAGAERHVADELGLDAPGWRIISDPQPGCPDDRFVI